MDIEGRAIGVLACMAMVDAVRAIALPLRALEFVIMGSVRACRRCPQIAEWVLSLADPIGPVRYEIADLKEWQLPFDDEPGIPAKGAYIHDHTRAWSAKVTSADGFVIVFTAI